MILKLFRLLVLMLFFSFSQATVFGQLSRTFLAGGSGNERFHSVFQLSDSTVLIAGEAENLNWIPTGTPIITLDTIGSAKPISTSPTTLGFILHCTKDLSQIVRVLRLPPNTLESINKIKTTSLPGQPTGELYFSGRRGGAQLGYFIGRLDKNFINGIPSKVEMGINLLSRVVSTGNKHQYDGPSYHRLFQPWDVDADGHVLAAHGEEFEFNWSFIGKYNRAGDMDSVEYFPYHQVELDGGTEWPEVTGRRVEVNTVRASQVPDSLWVRVIDNPEPTPDVFDSVAVKRVVGSGIVLKSYRAGGMRSQNQAEFDQIQTDENGNPGRKHFRTDDFLYSAVCTLGVGNCPNTGPGYLGYGPTDIWNARTGDIAIDKRNGDMYATYTIPTAGPVQQTQPRGKATIYDMQSVLVAFRKNGEIKWWARLTKEDMKGSSADQLTDGLAIDYAFNHVVILGRVYDTCTNNFWKGNELILNPGGRGFQNQWTGPDPKIEYSWLAKYELNSGKIRYATYVAENAKQAGNAGAALTNPLYNGYPNPNEGNPRLAETVTPIGGRTLDVDANGNVYLLSSTKGRAMTTTNAYQKVPLQDVSVGSADSLPPNEYAFVRIYNATLSEVKYSSAVASIWNPQDSSSRSPISLAGIVPTGNGFYLVGSHQGRNLASEVSVPPGYLNPPDWANDSLARLSGFASLHRFGGVPCVNKPSAISGPASHCPGEVKTYSVLNDPAATGGYQWILPGNNWSIVGPANGSSVQIRFTGNRGGQLRVVAKNENCISDVSYLNIPDAAAPPTVSTSGFVCATGGTAILTALGATPGNYRWYTDSTSNFPILNQFDGTLSVTGITATTRYWVAIVGGNGCETERRGVDARFGKAAPGISPLPANGPPYNALQAVPSALPDGVTRAWTKDGSPIGTGSVVGLTGPGNYRLCFTNACGDSCISYVVTSIATQVGDVAIRVFPNPAEQKLHIVADENLPALKVMSITDVLGKSLQNIAPLYASEKTAEGIVVDIANLESGIYFLHLEVKGRRKAIRFVKQ